MKKYKRRGDKKYRGVISSARDDLCPGSYKKGRHGRAYIDFCSVCGGTYRVNKDGTIRRHLKLNPWNSKEHYE